MILNEIKKELRRSKNLTLTLRYIILYKGTSVVIYDHEFVCQKKILNLKYVYNGYVSPDETKLLLVSNTNTYYLISLEDFSMLSAHSIKSPYNENLEGKACWNSNDSFLLPIQNSVSMLSTLRKFNCDSFNSFEDFLAELFWINYVTFVVEKNSYLIIGLDRNEDTWNVIWMDTCGNYTSYRIDYFDEAILDVNVCYDEEEIILTGESKVYSCDFHGVPADMLKNNNFENIIYHGFPLFFKRSKNNAAIIYLGTTNELVVYDLKHHLTINSYRMEFGARNIEEWNDIIFVCSSDGIKPISLVGREKTGDGSVS